MDPPFEIVRALGQGAAGQVFEVRVPGDPRRLAAKILTRLTPEGQERFRREGEIAARLRHPGVVAVHRAGTLPDGRPYLLFDLVSGRSLDQLLAERRRLPEGEVLKLGRQLAAALAHAHAQGVAHRDVKPANVLRDEAGSYRLSDFGIALALDHERLTRTGAWAGTPLYMAPEQLAGAGGGPASDVYALGVLLYECLAGSPPLQGETLMAHVREVTQTPAPDVRRFASVGAGLAAVISRCLEKDPAARYPGAAELQADLERIAAGSAPLAGARDPRRARASLARPLAAALLGAGVLLAAAALLVPRGGAQAARFEAALTVLAAGRSELVGLEREPERALRLLTQAIGRAEAELGGAQAAGPAGTRWAGAREAAARDVSRLEALLSLQRARRGREPVALRQALRRLREAPAPGPTEQDGLHLLLRLEQAEAWLAAGCPQAARAALAGTGELRGEEAERARRLSGWLSAWERDWGTARAVLQGEEPGWLGLAEEALERPERLGEPTGETPAGAAPACALLRAALAGAIDPGPAEQLLVASAPGRAPPGPAREVALGWALLAAERWEEAAEAFGWARVGALLDPVPLLPLALAGQPPALLPLAGAQALGEALALTHLLDGGAGQAAARAAWEWAERSEIPPAQGQALLLLAEEESLAGRAQEAVARLEQAAPLAASAARQLARERLVRRDPSGTPEPAQPEPGGQPRVELDPLLARAEAELQPLRLAWGEPGASVDQARLARARRAFLLALGAPGGELGWPGLARVETFAGDAAAAARSLERARRGAGQSWQTAEAEALDLAARGQPEPAGLRFERALGAIGAARLPLDAASQVLRELQLAARAIGAERGERAVYPLVRFAADICEGLHVPAELHERVLRMGGVLAGRVSGAAAQQPWGEGLKRLQRERVQADQLLRRLNAPATPGQDASALWAQLLALVQADPALYVGYYRFSNTSFSDPMLRHLEGTSFQSLVLAFELSPRRVLDLFAAQRREGDNELKREYVRGLYRAQEDPRLTVRPDPELRAALVALYRSELEEPPGPWLKASVAAATRLWQRRPGELPPALLLGRLLHLTGQPARACDLLGLAGELPLPFHATGLEERYYLSLFLALAEGRLGRWQACAASLTGVAEALLGLPPSEERERRLRLLAERIRAEPDLRLQPGLAGTLQPELEALARRLEATAAGR